MTPEALVTRFSHEVWNQADEAAAHEGLAPDFRFGGSLGPETAGVAGFIDYMRSVRAALAAYECVIEEMITANDRLAAPMTFKGVHQAAFFGVPSSGCEIRWAGAAFFTCRDDRISALWVLGDVDRVKAQLGAAHSAGLAAP
ncbi:MAG: ester cyclase [Pseudomonadota bacterium]